MPERHCRTGNRSVARTSNRGLRDQASPTRFDPAAQCPRWEKFVGEVFADDAELVGFVQRLLGYCITGDVSEHILAVFHGSGGNGKSVLLDTIQNALGSDFTMQASFNLLMAKRHEEHSTGITDLFGRRLVVASETDDGKRLSEALVKSLTGGDKLRARRMKQDNIEVDPTHKLILVTNHLPEIRGTDDGIWRRIRLVPFLVHFEEDRQDKGLKSKLSAEHEGILAWLVRGCRDWCREGLGRAEAVETATTGYRVTEDFIARFVKECCREAPEASCKFGDLFSALQTWCSENGDCHPTKKGAIVPFDGKPWKRGGVCQSGD
ncbi:MAG: phage/plasmid primase, P4 family, partial [Planctomycetota bacterium]|nr:phage/plasmid primase, P4 family [Planctomycetota bacterium]